MVANCRFFRFYNCFLNSAVPWWHLSKFNTFQKMKIVINIGLVFCLIPIYAVTYLYYLYFANPKNSLRHEYLEGVALTMVYTWPLWLILAGIGIWKRKKILKYHFVLSQIPLSYMVFCIILLRSLGLIPRSLGPKTILIPCPLAAG